MYMYVYIYIYIYSARFGSSIRNYGAACLCRWAAAFPTALVSLLVASFFHGFVFLFGLQKHRISGRLCSRVRFSYWLREAAARWLRASHQWPTVPTGSFFSLA